MWAEQAIYTSLARDGIAGYHVVARSPGVSGRDAAILAEWCPSHGALIVDGANRTSANFHPLPDGRFALSRTCEGLAEYSGRGGRQLYTHLLIFDPSALPRSGFQPVALYRDALALGHFRFRPHPAPRLDPAELAEVHPRREAAAWARLAAQRALPPLDPWIARLVNGQAIQLPFPRDRIALVECLLGLLPPDLVPEISFSTSLRPSAARPYRLILLDH
jgi:hypothetical protein